MRDMRVCSQRQALLMTPPRPGIVRRSTSTSAPSTSATAQPTSRAGSDDEEMSAEALLTVPLDTVPSVGRASALRVGSHAGVGHAISRSIRAAGSATIPTPSSAQADSRPTPSAVDTEVTSTALQSTSSGRVDDSVLSYDTVERYLQSLPSYVDQISHVEQYAARPAQFVEFEDLKAWVPPVLLQAIRKRYVMTGFLDYERVLA